MKAVNTRVSNIVLERDGYNMKASWIVPDEMIDRDNERCAQWVDSRFEFWIKDKTTAQHVEAKNKVQKGVGNPNPGALDISYTNADFFWVRGQGTGDKVTKNFDRNRYYPNTSRKCSKVKVAAWGGNAKGNGIKLWTTYYFGLPRKPKITWSFNEETKVATVKVETDPGNDKYERYDTRIKIDFLAPGDKKYQPFSTSDSYKDVFSTTQTEFTLSRDMSGFMGSLTNDKPIKLRCRAFARGILGDNPKVHETGNSKQDPIKAEMVIALPTAATVGTVKVDKKNASGVPLDTSRITVPVTCGKNTSKVTLQRRLGEDGSWSNVDGAVDNGNCKALYDSYGNFSNEAGQYVYYRIESENYGLKVHSAPKRADCLYVAKPKPACNASMEILSMTQTQRTIGGSVEVGVYVRMAFTDSTSNAGCELSWSEYPNAWNSNNPPDTAQVTYKDPAATTAEYTKVYKNTCGTNVYGLTPGTTYYFRMRRYRVVDGETYYSDYDTSISERKSVKVEGADADDKCWIESAETGDDGTSVALTIRFKEDNVNTGTEVSWSQDEHAWKSNEQPSTMEATWKTAQVSGEWTHVQDVYLRGMERGMKYYAYARRYQDHTGGRSYAPYSKQFTFTTPLASAASADVRCGLVSVESNGGTGAMVVIGWDGSHTGCEASWSTDSDAWESSTAPETFEFDWQDSWNKSGFRTEDETIDSSKTYYTRTGDGTDESPYVYEKVASPSAADLGIYYELPWSHTSTCYIAGLEEGSTYYVKARSYYGDGDDRKWSGYTSPMTVIPYAAPDSVVLDAPTTATDAEGSSIELYWSVGSEMPQTEWNLYQSDVTPNRLLLSGSGSLCRTSLPWSRFGGLESISFYIEAACGGGFTRSNVETVVVVKQPECHAAIASVLTTQPASFEVYADRADVSALATCRSEGITVTLPDRDVEQVGGDVVWTSALSPAFSETTWGETAYRQRLADAVTAAQAEVDTIEDEIAEMDEDDPRLVIAQNSLDAANARLATAQAAKQADLDEHPADGTVYAATVDLPVTDLYDGGNYVISVQTAESVAGLTSSTVELPFSVNYAHKATTPPSEITVTPDVEARSARVTLAPEYEYVPTEDTSVDPSKTYYTLAPWIEGYDGPEYVVVEDPQDGFISSYLEYVSTAEDGDVYDVYRKTQDGYDLISSNNPLEGNVLDNFAPFGNVELAYRVCYRTADGSIAFRDFPYRMDVRGTRFDWDNKSVELPWNVETTDSYSKSFEARSHVDGSVNGYYDKAVTRTGTLSTDTMKVREQGTLELVRALGNYAGACFCRTDKGAAFQCNAELSEVSTSYSTGAVPVRFELTRMDLSQEFMVKDEEDVDG